MALLNQYNIFLICAFGLFTSVLGGVFDFTEFDDPLSTVGGIGQARGIFTKDYNVCNVSNTGTGVIQYGQCTPSGTCTSPASTPGQGSCGTLSTCCVYSGGCGVTTNRKITYFAFDGSTQAAIPRTCSFTITPYNKNIYQLRLDLVSFQLTNPRQPQGAAALAYQCLDDYMSISSSNSKIPQRICGFNTGQHLYIPMNVTNQENSVTITINLANRTPASGTTTTVTLQTPIWNIRISQLEAPGPSSRGVNYANDFHALAPLGCLQYYTERTGTVMNLGYNPGQALANNFYLANMDYSLCFKREPGQCSITFTVVRFSLGGPPTGAPPTCTFTDYLFLADSSQTLITGTGAGQMATTTMNVNYYCGTTLSITGGRTAAYFGTMGQFPFYLHFKTDEATGGAAENGFLLNYVIGAC